MPIVEKNPKRQVLSTLKFVLRLISCWIKSNANWPPWRRFASELAGFWVRSPPVTCSRRREKCRLRFSTWLRSRSWLANSSYTRHLSPHVFTTTASWVSCPNTSMRISILYSRKRNITRQVDCRWGNLFSQFQHRCCEWDNLPIRCCEKSGWSE